MKELVDQLKRNRTLSPEELRLLLTDASPEEREYLHRAAREVARVHFGNGVFVRGLIEISNYCRNDCRYCGIRRSNRLAERYRLTPETVLACCEEGYRLGFRTFVLQGGEDSALNDELLTGLIREMRRRWPDCAITLSGNGRMRGILAGANVVMPNLSPPDERSKYNLYDGKAAFGAEAAEGLAALERELNEIGRHISWSRGDYQE